MTQPKTILQIAGIFQPELDWSRAALIMMDFQQEYLTGALRLPRSKDAAITAATKLLQAARNRRVVVCHVAHHAKQPSKIFDPDTSSVDFIESIRPIRDEPVIIRESPNAFHQTDLAELLILSGKEQLIFCGFMSHLCIGASVHAAFDLGFEIIVCADACATRDLSSENGLVLDAGVVHEVSMAALGDLHAAVCLVDDLPGVLA